ncbi:MAG: AAA family ATPase [Planctomycetes bacterium]|nr:AAA family ATPase [Planctomycetota bacterium]MCC7173025.1 AAA family ATPase [Planctomycetota bacterium]
MDKSTVVLVVGSEALAQEVEAVSAAVKSRTIQVQRSPDLRRAGEAARTRRPDAVIVELGRDLRELHAFAAELESGADVAPVVVGAWSRETFLGEDPSSAYLIEATRARVRDFVRRPVSSTELAEVLERHLGARVASRAQGRVIAFVSNKGGVGKSTLAVSTACALAKTHGDRVVLIDASLQLGLCASMLDLEPTTTLVDAVMQQDRLDETLLRELTLQHACGLRVLAAPKDAMDAARIDDASLARVLSVARRAFDYVVVDTFPLLDSIAVAILDFADDACVVVTPTVPHVLGALPLLDVLERLGVGRGRQRIVLNHSHPRVAGTLTPEDVATRLQRRIDAVFPFDKGLLVAQNTGEPYALAVGRLFGFGRALAGFVDELARPRGAVTSDVAP